MIRWVGLKMRKAAGFLRRPRVWSAFSCSAGCSPGPLVDGPETGVPEHGHRGRIGDDHRRVRLNGQVRARRGHVRAGRMAVTVAVVLVHRGSVSVGSCARRVADSTPSNVHSTAVRTASTQLGGPPGSQTIKSACPICGLTCDFVARGEAQYPQVFEVGVRLAGRHVPP